jgi:hypothetical protein
MRLDAFLPRGRIVLGVAALLLLHLPVWADTPDERASLKGLGAVAVMVGILGPNWEGNGLTVSQLQTDVELRLRQGGIRVTHEARGYLTVNVTIAKGEAGTYAVNILLRLNQMVRLERNLQNIPNLGTTWQTDDLFLIGAGRLRDVRSKVADLVDKFINAYLEQNPKQ